MNLPAELKSPRKGLISIKSKDKNCFLWCHVRHVNPLKEHPERITKKDKKTAEKLDNDGTDFTVREYDFAKICINIFCYEDELVFPKYILDQKFEKSMDLLFVTGGDKSNYVYIKDFDRFFSQNKE